MTFRTLSPFEEGLRLNLTNIGTYYKICFMHAYFVLLVLVAAYMSFIASSASLGKDFKPENFSIKNVCGSIFILD